MHGLAEFFWGSQQCFEHLRRNLDEFGQNAQNRVSQVEQTAAQTNHICQEIRQELQNMQDARLGDILENTRTRLQRLEEKILGTALAKGESDARQNEKIVKLQNEAREAKAEARAAAQLLPQFTKEGLENGIFSFG